MKTSSLISAAVMLIFITGCSEKVDFEAARKAVLAHKQQFVKYMNNENINQFAALFESDARITRPDSTTYEGTAEINQWIDSLFTKFDYELEVQSDKMLVYPAGKRAFDRGVYHITRKSKTDDTLERESGWYRMFWHLQEDGSWRLSRLNWLKAPSYSEEEDAF